MTLHERIAKAIRDAASRNPSCSVVPGPYVAGIYADAVITELGLTEEARPMWGSKSEASRYVSSWQMRC